MSPPSLFLVFILFSFDYKKKSSLAFGGAKWHQHDTMLTSFVHKGKGREGGMGLPFLPSKFYYSWYIPHTSLVVSIQSSLFFSPQIEHDEARPCLHWTLWLVSNCQPHGKLWYPPSRNEWGICFQKILWYRQSWNEWGICFQKYYGTYNCGVSGVLVKAKMGDEHIKRKRLSSHPRDSISLPSRGG